MAFGIEGGSIGAEGKPVSVTGDANFDEVLDVGGGGEVEWFSGLIGSQCAEGAGPLR